MLSRGSKASTARRRLLAMLVSAVAFFGIVGTSMAVLPDPGSGGDDPVPPIPNCPARQPSPHQFGQILSLVNGKLPFRRVNGKYEVFFTLNPVQAIYNPPNDCNNTDGVATKAGSFGISETTAAFGDNPFNQVIVTITPSLTNGAFFCFKLKYHDTNTGIAYRKTGSIFLPAIAGPPNPPPSLEFASLTDTCAG